MANGYTYIEMCIALTLFSMIIMPFGMMHLTNVKTRMAIERIEKRTQYLESLGLEIKKELLLSEKFFESSTNDIKEILNQYDNKVTLYDLKDVPTSVLPNDLVQLLKSNHDFNLSDAIVTIGMAEVMNCQTQGSVFIGKGKIKVGEKVVGLYLDIAKGDTSFNLKENAKTFNVITLILKDIQVPFTIKLANATEKPLLIQLQGDTTYTHFIVDDPNNQTTFVKDNHIVKPVDYKIATIQVDDKIDASKQLSQTLFFEIKATE